MADRYARSTKNIAGKYYVDVNCISCGQCVDMATEFFAEDKDSIVYVKAQPSSKEGIALCEQALASCPVGSIGNDGD